MWSLCFARMGLTPRSWTTTAYRWLFRDSPPQWGPCDPSFSSHQTFLPEVELRQRVFWKETLSFRFASGLRNFSLLENEYKYCASLILTTLSQDVPNLSPEKRVRVHAILRPLDYLWTPPTQEDLANGRPNLDCHPSLYFRYGFLRVLRTTIAELVRHFALELDMLKTIPAMSMLANCFQI